MKYWCKRNRESTSIILQYGTGLGCKLHDLLKDDGNSRFIRKDVL